MRNKDQYLQTGTRVKLESGGLYEIAGEPVGAGGGSVIYPVYHLVETEEGVERDAVMCVMKECFPVSFLYGFHRNNRGEIVPDADIPGAKAYLRAGKQMLRREKDISQDIYRTGNRVLPVLEAADRVTLTGRGGEYETVENTVTIMESLAIKGKSLHEHITEQGRFPVGQAFRVIREVLYALREIHAAGYLHLDLQTSNIFMRGTLEDESGIAAMLDFGSARPLAEDGKTEAVRDRVLFSTPGFSAPEMIDQNDGTLCLTPETDLYSVGYLLFCLLFGENLTSNLSYYWEKEQLKATGCPRHLLDTLEQILRRCVTRNPRERYHTAEEMLEEADRFWKAVTPYRSDLSGVKYDAFICYEHGSDSDAAEYLQQRLEHFRLPFKPEKTDQKRRPFERVFVDDKDSSSGPDRDSQTREALDNSGWLIVLCSPGTPQSNRVGQQIDRFLQRHSRSRILAVLLEGTPGESFPEALKGDEKYGEVLAADACTEPPRTPRKTRKLLRQDALLKLAAPMLGTTFDTLKQRRKIYRMHRILQGALVTFSLMLALTCYTLYQNRRVSEALTETQISKSRFLARLSTERLTEGDRETATDLALQGLPASSADDSRPVTTEAVSALQSAVLAYTPASFNVFQPKTILKTDAAATGDLVRLSADEEKLLTIDASGKLWIFDLGSDEAELSLTAADFYDETAENSAETICGADFLAEDTILLYLTDRLLCYDIGEQESVWETSYGTVADRKGEEEPLLHTEYCEKTAAVVRTDLGRVYLGTELNAGYYFYILDSASGKV